MDPRIVPIEHEEVFGPEKNIVLLDDPLFFRGQGDPKLFSRRTDDGSGLQENDPVLFCNVVGMDLDVVEWHFSSEQTHRPNSLTRRLDSPAKVYRSLRRYNPGRGRLGLRSWFG